MHANNVESVRDFMGCLCNKDGRTENAKRRENDDCFRWREDFQDVVASIDLGKLTKTCFDSIQ